MRRSILTTDDIKHAHVVGFMSGKGGVGKTSLSVNIANFCADNGAKVLLIDCDFNTHGATTFFSFNKEIERMINNENVINFQKILTTCLNREAFHTDMGEIGKELISVRENFDFISAGFKGKVFEDTELTKDTYLKLAEYMDGYFEQWKKQYDLILLDFCAGNGDVNSLLSRFIDNVCIVLKNDEISRKAVKTTLSVIFKERELDEIICCVNIIKSEFGNKGSSVEPIMNTVEGFMNSDEYDAFFNKGQTLPLDDEWFCDKLCEIIRYIWKNNFVVSVYKNKIKEQKRKEQEVREERIRVEQALEWEYEIKRRDNIQRIRLVVAIVLAIIAVPVIWAIPCDWWIKLICSVGAVIIEWIILGRGRLYSWVSDAIGNAMYELAEWFGFVDDIN